MLRQDLTSRSSVIRLAIENFISENIEELASKKLVVRLPNNIVNRLVEFINSGDVLNLSSAVQIALVKYLESLENYYITKRQQLMNSRLQFQKEIANNLSSNNDLK